MPTERKILLLITGIGTTLIGVLLYLAYWTFPVHGYSIVFIHPFFQLLFLLAPGLLGLTFAVSLIFGIVLSTKSWVKWIAVFAPLAFLFVLLIGEVLVLNKSKQVDQIESCRLIYKSDNNESVLVANEFNSPSSNCYVKKIELGICQIVCEVDLRELSGMYTVYGYKQIPIGKVYIDTNGCHPEGTISRTVCKLQLFDNPTGDGMNWRLINHPNDTCVTSGFFGDKNIGSFRIYNNDNSGNHYRLEGDVGGYIRATIDTVLFYDSTRALLAITTQEGDASACTLQVAIDSTTGIISWRGVPQNPVVYSIPAELLPYYSNYNLSKIYSFDKQAFLFKTGDNGEQEIKTPEISSKSDCISLDDCAVVNLWRSDLIATFPEEINTPEKVVAAEYENRVCYFTTIVEADNSIALYEFDTGSAPRKIGMLQNQNHSYYELSIVKNEVTLDITGKRLCFSIGNLDAPRIVRTSIKVKTYWGSMGNHFCFSSDSSYIAEFWNNESQDHANVKLAVYDMKNDFGKLVFNENNVGDWFIDHMCFSPDGTTLYFDNYGEYACIWEHEVESDTIRKIIAEHNAHFPFAYEKDGRRHVVYILEHQIFDAIKP